MKIVLPVVFLLCSLISGIKAQTPADIERYRELYPTNPYIRLKDEASVEVRFNKQGKPEYLVKETDVVMVMADNLLELSRTRKYFNSNTEIKKIEAYSLVPSDGKYIKIKMPEMKKITDSDNSSYYDDTYCMEGAFPSVMKGSILYYTSEYISHDAGFGFRFFFGSTAPVEHTSFSVTFPDNVKLVCRMAGKDTTMLKYSVTNKGNMTTLNWEADKLKGYFTDELAPTGNYYLPHVIMNLAEYNYQGKNFRLMGDIDDLFKWQYNKLRYTNIVPSPEVKQMADSITQNCTTPREKVAKIYQWVQEKIKYVDIEDGENGFVPQQASTVLSRRYGDCKDKSSMLTALINAVGEKASFAVVGSRSLPYTYTQFPCVSTANHLVAVWWNENNQPVILDGTALHYKPGDIPTFIQGKQSLIIKDSTNYQLYTIPVDAPDVNLSEDTLSLQIEGNRLFGKGVSVSKGDLRFELIRRSEGKSETQKKELLSSMLDFAGNKMEISDCSFTGSSNDDKPFVIRYDISLPDYCVASGDRLYVNLNLHQQLSSLDIKPDRTIPVETDNTYLSLVTTKLTIPKGYTIAKLPDNAVYTNPKFSFSVTYKAENNSIIQETRLKIDFLLLEGDEIKAFRDMIQMMKQAYRKTVMFQKSGEKI